MASPTTVSDSVKPVIKTAISTASNVQLWSVDQVRLLNAKQLNKALRQVSQCTSGKREHKIRLLCDALGIGPPKTSFQEVLTFVKNTASGWTKDIRKCPGIDIKAVTSYLLRSHDTITHTVSGDLEEFSPANLKRYKTLRSFELYRSGHVHSMKYQPSIQETDYCALKGKCNPSWDTSGTVYECLLVMKRDGQPVGSTCICTAGLGEACTHVAAMLFGLEDFTSLGYQNLPDDPACTELLCSWNAPKNPKVEPLPLKELSYQCRAFGKNNKNTGTDHVRNMKRKLLNHNPVAPNKRTVDSESYKQLVHDLSLCQPDVPFLTIADPHKWEPIYMVPSLESWSTLPAVINASHPCLLPAAEVTVVTSDCAPPNTLTRAQVFMSLHKEEAVTKDLIDTFISSIQLTANQISVIESLTMGQSLNKNWVHYRKGIVTSTSVHAVYTRMKSVRAKRVDNAERLVNVCIGSSQSFAGNYATKYGLKHEIDAAKVYSLIMKQTHKKFELTECGLKISQSHPFIGSSVDRLANCSCHTQRPVEIKCPSSMELKTKTSFSELPFLNVVNDEFVLKNMHPYYTQVQCHMAVTGSSVCDFVIWSPKDTVIIHVPFDRDYWASVLDSVSYFFRQFLTPKILDEVRQTCAVPHKAVECERQDFVKLYVCGNSQCKRLLVDADNLQDNKDASVMCECNCGCAVWYHWHCSSLAEFDIANVENVPKWYCPQCIQCCNMDCDMTEE